MSCTSYNSENINEKNSFDISSKETAIADPSSEEISSKKELILGENQTINEISIPFVFAFQENFPNAKITKIRWQYVPELDVETMIVEGIEGNQKHVNKYSSHEHPILLGSETVELLEEDWTNKSKATTPIDLEGVLTINQLKEIAWSESEDTLIEWILSFKYDRYLYNITVYNKETKQRHKGTIDAKTGEILVPLNR